MTGSRVSELIFLAQSQNASNGRPVTANAPATTPSRLGSNRRTPATPLPSKCGLPATPQTGKGLRPATATGPVLPYGIEVTGAQAKVTTDGTFLGSSAGRLTGVKGLGMTSVELRPEPVIR